MGSKRRRLALSCVDCRKRKVKCDRSLPSCMRCQKGGHADTCLYVHYDDKNSALPTPTDDSPEQAQGYRYNSTGADSWVEETETWQRSSTAARPPEARPKQNPVKRPPERSIQELQDKVLELETYMRSAGSRTMSGEKLVGIGPPSGSSSTAYRESFPDHERALLRGQSFKTQYFGPSHATSLLLQFEDLSFFVREILQRIPTLERVREIMKKAREEQKQVAERKSEIQLNDLIPLVPPRERADVLVEEYFATFETTYRILHVPSFYGQYEQFWLDPQGATADFVVQLLLVMACVNAVVPGGDDGFVGRSSVGRETASAWTDVCEAWLERQSQKHTYLAIYQIRLLIIVAKKVLCVKIKREFVNSGTMLRHAMSAGLHREPTFLSKKIGVFDQEMRRRLWFTIMELELQSACDRGLPTWVEWDCLAPLNVHDEDFSETTQSMPSSKPLHEFTRTSFLCHAAQHLPLRLEMLNRINSISHTIQLDSVMAYDDKLRQILDDIPPWPERPLTIMPRALSRLVLYEFVLLLHQPFATRELAQSRFFYSRCARRNTSLAVMKTYGDLLPNRGLWLSNLRTDAFRACLATCHDIAVAGDAKDDMMQDKNIAIGLIQKTVDLLEARVKALGQGFHSYWLSSSALGLVKSKVSADVPLDQFAQEAVDRVVRLHDNIMLRQRPGYVGAMVCDKLFRKAAQVSNNTHGEGEQPAFYEGLTPVADPFNDSVFDFDLADIWNMNSFGSF